MQATNIYMAGVGGQGIGLLSEVLLRAADYAGFSAKAVDTHGLAQRGGIVVSQLRLGSVVHTPLIPEHEADLVVALERHEALRALNLMARENAALVYYDTVWQPLDVRLGAALQVSTDQVRDRCKAMGVRLFRVHLADIEDTRMQNVAVMAAMDRHELIAGMKTEHFKEAMRDLMAGGMLEKNLAFFDQVRRSDAGS